MLVLGTASDRAIFDKLVGIDQAQALGNGLIWHSVDKLAQKTLSHYASTHAHFLAIIKGAPTLIHLDAKSGVLMKTLLNWQALTRRIVSAGRKSELVLQACKLTAGMRAIDAMAGFGHDGLILASTGARVTLIERNPIMALLLFYEYNFMRANPNWQKLLARMELVHGAFEGQKRQADVIYLDPMFPAGSYDGKVGKHMQLLHGLAASPTKAEESQLLMHARATLNTGGRVVVKRPKGAPNLAMQPPNLNIDNDALRFDVYLKDQ